MPDKLVSFCNHKLEFLAKPIETLLSIIKILKITEGPVSTDKMSKLLPSCFIKITRNPHSLVMEMSVYMSDKKSFILQSQILIFSKATWDIIAKQINLK